MERPQALATLWTLFQIVGWAIALDSVAQYFADRHYQSVFRKAVLLYFHFQRGLEGDPAVPRPPESWEQWYNS